MLREDCALLPARLRHIQIDDLLGSRKGMTSIFKEEAPCAPL